MNSYRVKVFLSGIVNLTNAQNLNCRSLMEHLDPTKFEVRALTMYSGNLSNPLPLDSSYYPIRYPARIWYPIQLIRGILWSDVSFLCKPEYWRLQHFLLKSFHKKAFKTIEGAFIGTNLEKAIETYGSIDNVRQACSFTKHTYSITKAMKLLNDKIIGLSTEKKYCIWVRTQNNSEMN